MRNPTMKTHRIARSFLILVTAWAIVPAPAHAQALSDFLRTNPKFVQNFREVVAGPRASTVRIRNDGKDVALGVVVGEDGWIVTKAYDLKGAINCRLSDGRELDARIVGVHAVHDLALLKIDAAGLPVARLKPSKSVPVGSWVASVGTGTDPVAIGVVSVPTRDVVFKGLPIAAADLAKIGYLGVALEPSIGAGVRITQLLPNTAAAKAGLKMGDVILSVSGIAIDDPEQFQAEMMKRKAGDLINLQVRRGAEEIALEATLQQRPAGDNRGDLQNLMGSDLSPRRSGYPTILTHDSVVKPADCGGPLVDLDGNVVGINISRAGRTESWAVPTEVIQGLLADLKSGKLSPTAAGQPMAVGAGPALTPADRPATARPSSDERQPGRRLPPE
jgi:serine protease Do